MKWKKINNWLLDSTEEAEKEPTKEALEPVSIEDVEEVIELIKAAHKIGTPVKASLTLPIDTFTIDSDTFKSIKIQKSKKEEDKVVIAYTTPIMSTETTIDINNIYGIVMSISFSTKEEQI